MSKIFLATILMFTFIMFAVSHLVFHDLDETVFWGVLLIVNYITVIRWTL